MLFSTENMQRDLEWDVLFQHQYQFSRADEDEIGPRTYGTCSCKQWDGPSDQHNAHVAAEAVQWLLVHLTANAEDMAEAVSTFRGAWIEADRMNREGLRTQSGLEALVQLGWRKVNIS